ncbi:hypothetical protein QW131_06155 [Roseibium salinum]|nr:hypothetical protein [Roseibium salinum]
MSNEEDLPGDPVCYAHKLVGGHIVDEQTFRDVSRFRKAERTRLVEKNASACQAASAREKTAALVSNLRRILQGRRFTTIAAYWPIRGEPDLRPPAERPLRSRYHSAAPPHRHQRRTPPVHPLGPGLRHDPRPMEHSGSRQGRPAGA